MLDESGEQFYLPVNHKQATFNLRRWASGDQLEKNNEHQWLNTYEKKLTNGCLQMVHTIDLAASLILAWLFDTFPLPLSALRSRFWAALAPYVFFGEPTKDTANEDKYIPHSSKAQWSV